MADAPKVLCPSSLTFEGTTWDARRCVLSIRARAGRPTHATWHVLWPQKPKSVAGPRDAATRFQKGRLTLAADCDGRVEWNLHY